MRKVIIKKGEDKMPLIFHGIFVNGYIIKATMCNQSKDDVQYNITYNTTAFKKEK